MTEAERNSPAGSWVAELFSARRDPMPPLEWPRWLRRLPHVAYVVLAVWLGLGNIAYAVSDTRLPAAPAVALTALHGVAVVLALLHPAPAWWLGTGAGLGTGLLIAGSGADEYPWPWSGFGMALQSVLLLLLALRVPARTAGLAFAVTAGATYLAGAVVVAWRDFSPAELSTMPTFTVVLYAVSTGVGALLRWGRMARTQLVAQETLTAEERARRTLLEERSRIARELHDVVAHHMSVISIQAQVAPHLVTDPPPELTENLASIRAAAVEALTELRRVLGVLRAEQSGDEASPDAPQPTLAQLDALLAGTRAAGLTVTAELDGTERPLPPGVELSAFRIVQEALSNALRHAPGCAAHVVVRRFAHGLRVQVRNGPPRRPVAASPGAGHGLLGMRERAAMLGGELAVGPTPDGGYEVAALLPLTGPDDDVHAKGAR